jgi:putative tricarboxylic transport membrane protein
MTFDWTSVFTLTSLLWAAGGAALGIVCGALPGLAANTTIALLLGFTYGLPVDIAVIFLIGVWTGSEFGGAISAILVNIPGTPEAVPTQLAGHPLALRGQGGLAVGTAILASACGNWVGLGALVLLVPVIIDFALRFGSWEMFLLAMLGIALSGAITSREQAIKGWLMGWVGLLIAMVGKDPIHGVERYTFGIPELGSGLGYMPLLIGVFGLTEVISMLGRTTAPPAIPREYGSVIPRLSTLRRYWKAIVRSGAIGTFVGATPGAGAQVASYLSYAVGERVTGRRFSDGDLEGVVCAQVASDANIGGGLLPTVTLGVPGNNSSALIMAVLAVHGVVVGPNIQTQSPGFIYFLYMTLLVANLFMYAIALGMIRPCLRLLTVPTAVIMSSVAVLGLIGTFAPSFSMFDVFVMFVSGVIGYGLHRRGYPFAPLVLGVVLGPLADDNLRRTLLLYEDRYDELLQRPLGIGLMVAVALAFWLGLRRRRDDTLAVAGQQPAPE